MKLRLSHSAIQDYLGDERLPHRFWAKVSVDQETGCWLWTGANNGKGGYGRFLLNRKFLGAHRLAYEVLVGPIPVGLQLDHLCRVTRCCNPAHLEPVTPSENYLRSTGPAKAIAAKRAVTHCPHGHEYDAANTYVRPSGARVCRACRNAGCMRRYYAVKAASLAL